VATMTAAAAPARVGRLRYSIVVMLFLVTAINYADRATIAIAGPALSKDLGLSPVQMGYVFSAFGWAYVLLQVPGGWLLDRFGSTRVYFASIFLWSFVTVLQGGVFVLSAAAAVVVLFALRFLVGAAEAPSFPANARIVAAWFPADERGTASAIFNSAQYFATVLFAPVMGFITHAYGWPWTFAFMGGLGIAFSLVWLRTVYAPRRHPRLTKGELDHIAAGGGLVNMDEPPAPGETAPPRGAAIPWRHLKVLLANRMLAGIYLGQFCINALTYFFITWFPVYLVQQRGMSILSAGLVASIPAICGFVGGVLGGVISDWMLRRGFSLTAARKTPIVAGMLLSTSMVACNYVDAPAVVIAVMALAFFGKGIGALGWAVIADAAPREIAGVSGGLFNMFGNISSITTPIVIGYIIQGTGSFNGALVFIGANAVVAVLAYLLVVGEIRRVPLAEPA
jgi:MFS transporter, ACS family, glucarate transporter